MTDDKLFYNPETGATGFITKDSGKRTEFASGMVRDIDEGKPRFDLIRPLGVPYKAQMLTRFAELMARGAKKYCSPTAIGISELVECCTCDNLTAILSGTTTLKDSAETAMSKICALVIQRLPSASARTQETGQREQEIENEKEPSILLIVSQTLQKNDELNKPDTGDGLSLGSLQKTASSFLLRRMACALSVETSSVQEVRTWITTTKQALLEDFSALVVTRAWGSLVTRQKYFGEHSDICLTRHVSGANGTLIKANNRNWEQANGQEELDRMKASALRHAEQWFHGETDEDHAAAIFFNVMAYETTKYKMEHGQ